MGFIGETGFFPVVLYTTVIAIATNAIKIVATITSPVVHPAMGKGQFMTEQVVFDVVEAAVVVEHIVSI